MIDGEQLSDVSGEACSSFNGCVAYLVGPLHVMRRLAYIFLLKWQRRVGVEYLDLPQLSPFGLVRTERTDAVDLGCLRHC